jgi:NAD(P)-dependent dehydrogenase (short-subunit alcohol dehydrogenase family)
VFDKTLNVNLKGVLFGLKYGTRFMNDGGSIINTASLAASATMPEYTAYAISKAGVVKLTEQAAVEPGSRAIRVNAVCPGTTVTPMEPADSE